MGDQHGLKTAVLNLQAQFFLAYQVGQFEHLIWKLAQKLEQLVSQIIHIVERCTICKEAAGLVGNG